MKPSIAEHRTTEQATETLKANRHIRSDEESRAFEDALTFLAAHPDPNDLPDLHLAIDDDCDQHEIMFGLVDFIEDFDIDAQIRAFLDVMPEMIVRAPSWTRTWTVRILNNEAACVHSKSLLQSAPLAQASVARGVLEKIVASKKSPLEDRARFVLDG